MEGLLGPFGSKMEVRKRARKRGSTKFYKDLRVNRSWTCLPLKNSVAILAQAILAQDGLGRVPLFYHSLSMATADVCVAVASQAGKIWKRHRRALPPSAKALLAELLLDLRLHILPDFVLDAVGTEVALF